MVMRTQVISKAAAMGVIILVLGRSLGPSLTESLLNRHSFTDQYLVTVDGHSSQLDASRRVLNMYPLLSGTPMQSLRPTGELSG